jgi:TatD DNase family protein
VQKDVFAKQLIRAVELEKPIVVHTREAEDDTFEILKAHMPTYWKVHIHRFTDTPEFAKKVSVFLDCINFLALG